MSRENVRQIVDRARQAGQRAVRFGREFTDGLSRRDVERLFDEDVTRAWTVIAGTDPEAPPPKTWKERARFVALQVWAFFRGFAFKLSPARRLLFAFALLCPLLGLFDLDLAIGPTQIYVDAAPFWFLASIAGLTLLLALELVDRLRVRDELEVARALQRDLLPREDPVIPGYEVAHSYRTANEIGGDYYDFLPLGDGRVVLAVGDASGHGIGAGLLMAIANASLKTALDLDPSPAQVLDLLNRTLCRTGDRRAFMTLFYGILDPATGSLEYGCAGHPYPIVRRTTGELVEIGTGALPLGLSRDTRYAVDRTTIAPGELLVLYSDGLPEASGENDEAFGFTRLRQLVVPPPGELHGLHDRILDAVGRHLGSRSLSDDLTLVLLRRRPS